MKRGFRHPGKMYHGREAGPWFTGVDVPFENSWAGRPFPQCSQDYWGPQQGHGPPDPQWDYGPPDPQWGHGPPDPQWDHGPPDPRWDHSPPDPQWGHDPLDPQLGHPDLQWDHLNPWCGQDHQNSQCYPAPQWDQYHHECPSRDYGCGFDYGDFLLQGSSSYRRRSHGKFPRKGPKYKGKDSSHNSSRVLVEMQKEKSAQPRKNKTDVAMKKIQHSINKKQSKQVKKDESEIPKETKQAHEDSVALVKNTDPLQIKLNTGSKTEGSHQVACCTQAETSELPATQENLELKKEEEETEQDKLKGTQAQPSHAAFPPPAKAPMEGTAPANTAGSFHPVVKEESMATEAHCSLVASLASTEAPTETMKYSHPVVKEELAASLPSDEVPIEEQAPSKVKKSVHPMVKEEPVLVPETRQDMNTVISTDSSSVIEPSVSSCVVELPTPLETKDAILSLGREDELLESSQPTEHFSHTDSLPAVEIPFLSNTTDECQSEEKENLELTQMRGSQEDTDCCQACDVLVGGSSALPVIPSDVHSVPVLVSGKETELPYFWESESSSHAQNFNWSDAGKGWAPEDYQEPSWGVDTTKKCGIVSEPERDLVLSHSSLHSHYSCELNPDTRRVLEWSSSSPRSHNSDSKHSSTRRTIKRLRSPLRQGHHSRSPLRQRCHSRSPLRGREITRTDCCRKCHHKCCQNPSRERFREKELPRSNSAHKMHHYLPPKETSKCYRTSDSYSPENSTMTRKRKSTHSEETEKRRSTSVKKTKSSKVTKNGRKSLASVKPAAAVAVETSIPAETTEHFQPANTELYELVQLTPSSEDTGFPHQPCAWKETSTSAPSKIIEDPRSVAVLTRRNQIEEDYLQVILSFAVMATMLLQKEPCMEQALEAALRGGMRSIGDYYESKLKNFIDDYDLSETH